jgi:hypothetical protein
MSENIIYKEALKKAFLKEILPQQLENAKILRKEEIFVDDEISFSKPLGQVTIMSLINYLAKELASAKADLWIKTQTNKKE